MDTDDKLLDLVEAANFKRQDMPYTMEMSETKQSVKSDTRLSVKSGLTAVLSIIGIVYVTHVLIWAECTVPYMFVGSLPWVLLYKLSRFRDNPTMNDDMSWLVNVAVFLFLCIPYNSHVFQLLFSLASGPALLNSMLSPDALIINNPDVMSTIYLHWAPSIVLFCVRWYSPYSYWPLYWWKDNFNSNSLPDYNIIWSYAIPFVIFAIYLLLFSFITKLVIERHWNTVPIYSILQTQECIEEQSPSKIPRKDMVKYFALKCSGGLIVLLLPLVVYNAYKLHCLTLCLLFLYITWRGGCTN